MALHPGSHGSHNTQGLGGLLSGAGGAGQGLLGGEPGLLDLIPDFSFTSDNLNLSFQPGKKKRERALLRLIEEQAGSRVSTPVTETAGGMGRFLAGGSSGRGITGFSPRFSNSPVPGGGGQGGIPGFRGVEPFLFPELFKDIPGTGSTLIRGGL